jgi:hypothetical protein
MPLLKTFDYEIFLSYGWSGTNDPDRGARRWARQLRDLVQERLAVNLERPRIYFDENATRIGPFPDDIYRALEQSAILLFVVSPGSYRSNSWCQKEVACFWDHARCLAKSATVLAPEDRIIKIIQSPLSIRRDEEPLPLRDLRSFNLFERIAAAPAEVAEAADLQQPGSETVRGELDMLYATLRSSLERVRDLEQPDKDRRFQKRVFLGPTFSELDNQRFRELRRELLLEGHQVRSVTPLPAGAETEDEHQRRLERSVENVNLAVHFVPHTVPDSDWQRNPAAHQVRQCLLKSRQDETFNVFLWRDPDYTSFDLQTLHEIEEIRTRKGDQNAQGMIFGELKVNVKDILRKPPPHPRPNSADSFDIVIQHNDADSPEAARIRDYLRTKHNLKAQFANPTRPGSNVLRSIKTNEELFYLKAKGFVVLYGQTDDDWTNRVCFTMLPHIKSHYGALVVVAPPPEPPKGKKFYEAPDDFSFATRKCFDGEYESVIDEWLQTLSLMAVPQTTTS